MLKKIRAKKEILVVGPLYDNIKKWDVVESLFKDYEHIIINGSALEPNSESLDLRFERLNLWLSTGKVSYNLAASDWRLSLTEKFSSMRNFPNIILLNFEESQFNYLITPGGINVSDISLLNNNMDCSFIKDESYHNNYKGLLGYLITNNPLTMKEPKIYNYSIQIGNEYGGNVYAQEIGPYCLKKTILI